MRLRQLLLATLVGVILFTTPVTAQKFYPDDPLLKEPPPYDTEPGNYRTLSSILELVDNTFGSPGEQHPQDGVIPAGGVNTLGEVMDGPWYVNRHGRRRMTREELQRGPGDQHPPVADRPWSVLTVKSQGIRPGLLIRDSREQVYGLLFDPPRHLEMVTGANVVSSKLFYALGYWVPESYIVYFERHQLEASPEGEDVDSRGKPRQLVERDINDFLRKVPRDSQGRYRGVAIRIPPGDILGPYQFTGTRTDDPNDIVLHEHRRDLRGLYVFVAGLDHHFLSPLNREDILVEEDGIRHIRKYLVDFTATLGSSGFRAKDAWEGNERLLTWRASIRNFAGMSVYTPGWMRVRYPKFSAVGNFEYEAFDPEKWTPAYYIPPFVNRLLDDSYWAAKQVMAFTEEDIRTIVETGQYSNPAAIDWLVQCLWERRTKIGQTYFAKVLPLDQFRVENGKLMFDDLEIRYGFIPSRQYSVEWSEFANRTEEHKPLSGANSFAIPAQAQSAAVGSYFAARSTAEDPAKATTVYVRKEKDGFTVVGIDRDWPGKVLAQPTPIPPGKSRYVELAAEQRELFNKYALEYGAAIGRKVTPHGYFDSLSISEQTTYDAVTHALMNTQLTDAEGNSLGTALALVARVERIAGEYPGRQGDEQFRLYCGLTPNAREVIERSREFHRGKDNTVYHVGYPLNFRQRGKYPGIQFSLSENGENTDIDVDYLSSKFPSALWNGHLTSANSDVRARDNQGRHDRKWGDFFAWWKALFGKLSPGGQTTETELWRETEVPTPLPPDRVPGASIAEVYDAAEEFLTDWLVRRKYSEALLFVSDRTHGCLNTDEDIEDEMVSGKAARERLRDGMKDVAEVLGERDNLTDAIDAILPWDPSDRLIEHPYKKDFSAFEMTDRDAEQFLCDRLPTKESVAVAEAQPQYGNYYGVLFRFRVGRRQGGVLGLLWTRENETWRIISYDAFEQ